MNNGMRKQILVFTLITALIYVQFFALIPEVDAEFTGIIYSDPSDGYIRSDGTSAGTDVWLGDWVWVGDGRGNRASRAFFKFEVPDTLIPGGQVVSARLHLYLNKSKYNDVDDLTSPLTNIGLGDCLVLHIDDYGDLNVDPFSKWSSPSIGNDPGVLIGSSDTPDTGYISIDVTTALQDDVDDGRTYSTFMIKMSTDTDSDSLEDHWNIRTYEYDANQMPFIQYEYTTPVGGETLSIDILSVLTSAITENAVLIIVVCLSVATVATILYEKRKKD